jgi:Tfp pilus assembly protein PilW
MNKRGFTLLELVLYVSIASLVLMSTTGFFYLILQSQVKNQTVADVEQQGQSAMEVITQTIRNATGVNSPGIGASTSALSLANNDGAKDPTVFDLANGALEIKEGTASPINLTSDKVVVSNISFQNLSRSPANNSIRIRFTISHVNPGNKFEYDFSQSFYTTANTRN